MSFVRLILLMKAKSHQVNFENYKRIKVGTAIKEMFQNCAIGYSAMFRYPFDKRFILCLIFCAMHEHLNWYKCFQYIHNLLDNRRT